MSVSLLTLLSFGRIYLLSSSLIFQPLPPFKKAIFFSPPQNSCHFFLFFLFSTLFVFLSRPGLNKDFDIKKKGRSFVCLAYRIKAPQRAILLTSSLTFSMIMLHKISFSSHKVSSAPACLSHTHRVSLHLTSNASFSLPISMYHPSLPRDTCPSTHAECSLHPPTQAMSSCLTHTSALQSHLHLSRLGI